jgi:hypothetical protein
MQILHTAKYDLNLRDKVDCVDCVLYSSISVPGMRIAIRGGIFKIFNKEPRNPFQEIDSASLCRLAGRYDNPVPTRFLASKDCSKIPPQVMLEPCLSK